MTAAQDMIRGRSNIVTLTNNSGGALVAGDVCVQDATGDEYVTTTTSAASTLKVFVAAESIASAATGKFYESGYCPLVNVNASVTRGRFLFTHTVAKQAAENATYGAGAFGKILKSGTTPSAIIYSATAQLSGGAGSDTTAIHNNVASEISAITSKASPVSGDYLLIEDSADSNNKKRVTIGTLPSAGGTTTFTTAQASPPTANAAGDIWLPNNGRHISRATAADSTHWVPWGPLYPMADPNLQTFAWANQGSATVSSTNGGITLDCAANLGAGNRVRIKNKTAPWTVTAALKFHTNFAYANSDCVMGLCFSNGTAYQLFGIYLNAGASTLSIWLPKYSDASTYNSSYATIGLATSVTPPVAVVNGLPLWWRIADDNSNRICSVSNDGYKWFVVHTIGRTDYLTATQAGFFVNNISANYDAALSVLSWVET